MQLSAGSENSDGVLAAILTTPEGIRLATDIAGEPYRPRVIFAHGGQSRRAWRHTLTVIADEGFSVTSYDLRGHGDSDWAGDGDYSLKAHIRDITAIVWTTPRPVAIVGAALGGRVAIKAAATLGPAKVAALALIDCAPRMAEPGLQRVRDFVHGSMMGYASFREAEAAYRRFSELPVDNLMRSLEEQTYVGEDGRYYWRWDPKLVRSIDKDQNAIEHRMTGACAAIRCPALLVHADNSDLVDNECVEHFARALPHLQVAHVSGASGISDSERLMACRRALLDFLLREFAAD